MSTGTIRETVRDNNHVEQLTSEAWLTAAFDERDPRIASICRSCKVNACCM